MSRNLPIALAALILVIIVTGAIAAPWIASQGPNQVTVTQRLKPPGQGSVLGTDPLGRDILSRLLYGGRVSLIVGVTSVVAAGLFGTVLGMMAGYFGGIVDDVIGWLINVHLAFPFILLALALAATLGPGLGNIVFAMSVTSWVGYARVARAQTLSIRKMEYIVAAQALGSSSRRVLTKHILPNILSPLIVVATFQFARMIVLEASLGFLGLGLPEKTPSWGTMLAAGREYSNVAWWPSVMPGLSITVLVLAVNMMGDWLRDRFDPKLRI